MLLKTQQALVTASSLLVFSPSFVWSSSLHHVQRGGEEQGSTAGGRRAQQQQVQLSPSQCSRTPNRPVVTRSPTRSPTPKPIDTSVMDYQIAGMEPTDQPTKSPTKAPITNQPTKAPITDQPTKAPITDQPTKAPITAAPTKAPVTPAPVLTPETLSCQANTDLDVCIAVDMSGSVCSVGQSTGSPTCTLSSSHECCANYAGEKDFVEQLLSTSDSLTGSHQFAYVTYASNVGATQGLSTATSTWSSFDAVSYTGGATHTGGAIRACSALLAASSRSWTNKVIVLITDGTPTNPGSNSEALAYARSGKDEAVTMGFEIIPVLVQNSVSANLANLNSLGTIPDGSIPVTDFTNLKTVVNDVVDAVACSQSVSTPAPIAPISLPCSSSVPIDICFAVDTSGSVCSEGTTSGDPPCDPDYNDDCCLDYHLEKKFVLHTLNHMEDPATLPGPNHYSVVTFNQDVFTHSGLTTDDAMWASFQGQAYRKGSTNTGGGIDHCAAALASSTNTKVIVLVTDGKPTQPHDSTVGKCVARSAATNAKQAGIHILPVLVSTPSTDAAFLNEISSLPGVSVTDFDGLENVLGDVIEQVGCAWESTPGITGLSCMELSYDNFDSSWGSTSDTFSWCDGCSSAWRTNPTHYSSSTRSHCVSGDCIIFDQDQYMESRPFDMTDYLMMRVEFTFKSINSGWGDHVELRVCDSNGHNCVMQAEMEHNGSEMSFDQTIDISQYTGDRTIDIFWQSNDSNDQLFIDNIKVSVCYLPAPTDQPTDQPTQKPIDTSVMDYQIAGMEPTDQPTKAPVLSPGCVPVTLDFNDLARGSYLYDQYEQSKGVRFSARAKNYGFRHEAQSAVSNADKACWTPTTNGKIELDWGAVMVFDTYQPIGDEEYDGLGLCSGSDGDTDLGSPNSGCATVIAGGASPPDGAASWNKPGVGSPGASGTYANCKPQGHVCVIQESPKSCPDDCGAGGTIKVDFPWGADLHTINVLDVDDHTSNHFTVTDTSGTVLMSQHMQMTGENGLLVLPINQVNVAQLKIDYAGSGSLGKMEYTWCPPVTMPQRTNVIDCEGFESGWGIWNDLGSDSYRQSSSSYAYSGSYSIRLRDGLVDHTSETSASSSMETDSLSVGAYSHLQVTFHYYHKNFECAEDFFVETATSGSGTSGNWVKRATLTKGSNLAFYGNGFYDADVTFPTDFASNLRIRIRASADNNNDQVYVDEVCIKGIYHTGSA